MTDISFAALVAILAASSCIFLFRFFFVLGTNYGIPQQKEKDPHKFD